jgi:hypothetical protein
VHVLGDFDSTDMPLIAWQLSQRDSIRRMSQKNINNYSNHHDAKLRQNCPIWTDPYQVKGTPFQEHSIVKEIFLSPHQKETTSEGICSLCFRLSHRMFYLVVEYQNNVRWKVVKQFTVKNVEAGASDCHFKTIKCQ